MIASGESSKELVVWSSIQQNESPKSSSAVHSDREGAFPAVQGNRQTLTVGEPSKELVVSDSVQQKESPKPLSTVHPDKEAASPAVPEKPYEDGYNWRKYGQKNVKGNEFIKSYYKCSYHSCQVKKQVERAHDGRITDTNYFGKHDHPRPQSNVQPSPLSAKVQIRAHPLAFAQDKSSNPHDPTTDDIKTKNTRQLAIVPVNDESTQVALHSPSSGARDRSNNENPVAKRQKKGGDSVEAVAEKPSSESRLVIETVSAVDIVNDGYRWRKYGQKFVKGNPNPRSYYRCSNSGCPAKKHVERASCDSKVVITTYEGQHDHDLPPTRTLVPHSPSSAGAPLLNGVNKSKSEENEAPENGTLKRKREEGKSDDRAEKKELKDEAMVVAQTSTMEKDNKLTVEKDSKLTIAVAGATPVSSVKKEEKEVPMAVDTVTHVNMVKEIRKVPTAADDKVIQVNTAKEEEKELRSVDIVTDAGAVKKEKDDVMLDAVIIGPNSANHNASSEEQNPDTAKAPPRSQSRVDEQQISDSRLSSSCPEIKPGAHPKADAEPINC